MLTENNFHHHNGGSVVPQHRVHYAPYQPPTYSGKLSQQQQQNDLQTPKFDLHNAVRTNDVAGIIRLHGRLRQQPLVADACLLDSNGHTPLYTAIANGRLAMVDLLLHLGHNPYCISVARESALNVAITSGRLDIIDYLLSRGFPIDYAGFENKTPLERAIECNQGSVVVTLLKHGVDWRHYDEQRKTGDMSLIEWALAHEHPQVLGVLIDLYGDDESVFNQIGML
ncbi:unnamed protein product [Rotaria socialis]|uniref:Uncharacterized protein n=1 Tax=Rotaria socialis TaxID=392032 RepID=A0A818XTP6_9BILA|nr:unnamed protein product [Rotaria socialis]CAF3715706.1 unnamed protein product [Rotaria socialis]CAF3744927.1 unnamed protein product [Rotaria socialis]CAF4342541.1 unnamed protein product [Rotaria socialis]CAF4501902.1 unnamed protein product [Rotaria socialis]